MHVDVDSSHSRLLSLVATAALFSPGLGAPALADECGSNTLAVVAPAMDNGPASMPSYSASVQIRARMRGFPFLGMTLSGTSTYEKPGNYALLLNKAPRIADGVGALVHDLSVDITSSNHWSSYDATAACAAVGTLLVHLVSKTAGDTKAVDLTVDPVAAHVVKATFVRNDGTITVNQQFGTISGQDVIVHQEVALSILHVRADVAVDYRDINLRAIVAAS
jgi:uncharacterized protein YqkB